MMRDLSDQRAVSPVIGVALLLAIVLLLASVFSVGLYGFGNELTTSSFDRAVNKKYESSDTGAPYSYDDNITAVNNGAGETTRHIVTLNVTGNAVGNSLNEVTIEYTNEQTDVSETAPDDDLSHLLVIGIDTDNDGRIDTDAIDDVEPDDFETGDDGSKLEIELSGNYDLNADDTLVIVYEEVENPSAAGTYNVDIDLNGDRVYDGEISIT